MLRCISREQPGFFALLSYTIGSIGVRPFPFGSDRMTLMHFVTLSAAKGLNLRVMKRKLE